MGESAKILLSWRELYKAALFETETSKLQLRIESYSRLLPSPMVKLRRSKMLFMLCRHWRIAMQARFF
jgi:hypothetical protein